MKYTYLAVLLVVLFTSCSEYQKVLKSDDFNYKYSKAVSYYEDADFNRALPLFSELTTVMMGTTKMEEVSYYFAYCHFSNGDNLMAAHLFKNYAINYPNSKHAQECSYMAAYCYYLESPNYSLDATNNYKAIKALQAFINKISNIAQSNPIAMDIFQKTRMGDISLMAFWAVTILRYNHLAKASIRCPPK